jgi:tetratricopeptide (TPR) repeat protein
MKVSALAGALALAAGAACSDPAREAAIPAAPEPGSSAGAPLPAAGAFAGTAACAECHAAEHAAWTGSHHDLAMQEAREDTVLGDFDDALFEHRGVRTRFFRRDAAFLVETEGPDGAPAEFEVTHVIGVTPLQQVCVPFPDGSLQCLTVAWDVARGRWYSLHPDERREPGDAMHWTGVYNDWSSMCAECHVTEFAKAYDERTGTYASTWIELQVGCEACHGPGAEHATWARARGDAPDGYADDLRLAIDLRRGAADAQIDACAPCHSLRARTQATPPHGAPYLDGHRPSLLRADGYHADGQILGEVYVFGSFAQSRMHRRGVACTDCHEPHALELLAPGNAVCTQCHTPQAPLERFPTLARKDYDTPEHHHHEPGTDGARCVSCHMPARTYMGVDDRRDHGLRVPRPDLSVRHGTPNACNGCHADRDARWSAEAVRAWYGLETTAPPHFGAAFARARAGDAGAAPALLGVVGDAEEAAIVRATALELLADVDSDAARVEAAARVALADPSPLVRAAGAAALERVPPGRRAAILLPLCDDAVPFVRMEAARALASIPPADIPADRRASLATATAELEASLAIAAERPETHVERGLLAERRGDADGARAAYRRALAIDARCLPARFNLATLENGAGRNAAAIELLRGGIALSPEDGELHYALGLALAEEHGAGAAADALTRAAELLPDRARVRYNAGLALSAAGNADDAERELLAAAALDPRDTDAALAIATFYADRGDWEAALPHAERLAALAPRETWSRELFERVRRGLGR